MKKTIRLVALVLSLVMCAVLFAACDGSGSAGQASQSQQETSAPAETSGADTETSMAAGSESSTGGEAATKADGSKIKIGFSVGSTTEERWVKEMEMAQQYCDANGIELIVQSADDDANKQITQCQSMISQGVDVLIVAAKDSESAGVVCDMAHESGTKVVGYERGVNNGDVDYYIAFNPVQVGEIQAQMLVDRYPRGIYIWLHGGPEDGLVQSYIQGNTTVLQPLIDSGDITIVADQYCKNWSADEAMKHTENALSKVNNDVVAVVAPNDSTAGGVVQALAAQGLDGTVGVCGQDGDIAACQRIVEGTQIGTAFKYLPTLNTTAMEVAVELARGETDQVDARVTDKVNNGFADIPTIYIPVIEVNKENINDTIIASGFHSLEEVYANIPKDQWPDVEVTGELDIYKYAK